MNTNIELAELDYTSGMKYKDIAEKYAVSINTVKSWKTRNKWVRKGVHTKSKSMHTKKEKGCTQNIGANLEEKVRKKSFESVASNDELNEQQKLFCLYFTDTPNATRAYQKAYKANRLTAQVNGFNLLRNTKIKTEIDKLRQIKYESIMFNTNDLVERNMRIAFADITDFLDINIRDSEIGTQYNELLVKKSSELDGTVIQEVRATKDGVSIKLKDSSKAMDWLTKYFKLNPLDIHRESFDNAKLELERQKLKSNDNTTDDMTIKVRLDNGDSDT